MQMSDGERLIAIMLAEVMEHLDISQEIDPTLLKSLLINNNMWAIKGKYSGFFSSEPASDTVVSETTNILWMWGIIEGSLGKLTGDDAQEAGSWKLTSFSGFDGNNDDHYGVAQTMIEELDEFQSFKNRSLNSHSESSLPRYQRMYEKFDQYVKTGQAAPLSFDALRDLCN